jgi:hypothetical protein
MGWFDLVVAVLLAGFGFALVVIIAIEGATAIELGLVVILFGAGTLCWLNTSWGWEPIRRWRQRRSRQHPG